VAAEKLGVSFGYLAMLEGGHRVPSTVVAEVLIEGYRLTYDQADLLRSVALPEVGRDWRLGEHFF
jgi:transcriptional regulator with XRE-family HTH domain